MDKTIYAKLLAIKTQYYSLFVFQNLDTNEYIMCTRLPNWKEIPLKVGDQGFLTYEEAKRGETFVNSNMETEVYKYSNIYLKDFIKKNNKIDILI